MNDSELEERLRARLHERFDEPPPVGLLDRVMRDRPGEAGGLRSAVRLVIAAVLVVAAAAVAGSIAPWTWKSEAPQSADGTSRPTETSVASATPIPTFAEPSGSLPPISLDAWHRLDLTELTVGPIRASSVVAWSRGYIALGQTPNFSRVSAVWMSRDGRQWVRLPEETLTPPGQASAAPCREGVLIVTRSANGETTARYSVDGVTWTSTAWPEARAGGDSDLAGGERGAVAVVAGTPDRLVLSRDCVSWQDVDLPGTVPENVAGVAVYRGAFIAVGDSGTEPISPLAWWSTDGLAWMAAAVETQPGDGLSAVYRGLNGLVARGRGDFGKGSYWTSSDGRAWTVDSSNPLTRPQGNDPTLVLVADGTRLLAYGSAGIATADSPEGGPIEYWISFDGVAWERLDVSGPDWITQNWAMRPFLLRDGVLFSVGQDGPTPAWLGVAGS